MQRSPDALGRGRREERAPSLSRTAPPCVELAQASASEGMLYIVRRPCLARPRGPSWLAQEPPELLDAQVLGCSDPQFPEAGSVRPSDPPGCAVE
ncbi:hypothetical protein CB1_001609004 [Camelus ferus]|nr:hypothetical protein CB1_001609004 [Camelus ferus]